MLFGIPLYGAAVEIDLVHEVTGDGGAGADGDVADGLLAGLDGVEPVFVMVLRVVEFHLRIGEVFALGEDDFAVEGGAFVGLFVPKLVDRFAAEDELKLAAVHMDFAVFAEEGNAFALAIVVERDAAGVDELRAISSVFIIFRGDDFHRAVLVFAKAPLGDVDVMRTPVANHAAAVFAGHAPSGEVIVNATWAEDAAVRSQRGRAAPHVPVEAGLHGFFFIGVRFGS